MDEPTVLPFPVAGEITEVTWRQIAEGQPVLLLRDGRPAAVIVDLDSWEEAEIRDQRPRERGTRGTGDQPDGVTRARAGVCRKCSNWTMVTEGMCTDRRRRAQIFLGQLELVMPLREAPGRPARSA